MRKFYKQIIRFYYFSTYSDLHDYLLNGMKLAKTWILLYVACSNQENAVQIMYEYSTRIFHLILDYIKSLDFFNLSRWQYSNIKIIDDYVFNQKMRNLFFDTFFVEQNL
jgi:hypothetical protein